MSPPQRPPSATQMFEALSRLRATGAPFDRAWEVAYRDRVRWPHDGTTRRIDKEAIQATRAEWKAAYEGRETPLSRTLRAISEQAPAEESRDPGGGVLAA